MESSCKASFDIKLALTDTYGYGILRNFHSEAVSTPVETFMTLAGVCERWLYVNKDKFRHVKQFTHHLNLHSMHIQQNCAGILSESPLETEIQGEVLGRKI